METLGAFSGKPLNVGPKHYRNILGEVVPGNPGPFATNKQAAEKLIVTTGKGTTLPVTSSEGTAPVTEMPKTPLSERQRPGAGGQHPAHV